AIRIFREMREGFDKEIDSLLRVLPGASAGSRPRGNGATAPGAAAHLDADELSAFAEDALPASARVVASAHLADCDECRGIVVNLARAAGVEGEIEKRAAVSVPSTAASNAAGRGAASTNAAGAENQPARESPAGGPSSSATTDRLDTAESPAPPKDAPAPQPSAPKAAAAETVTVTSSGDQPKPS